MHWRYILSVKNKKKNSDIFASFISHSKWESKAWFFIKFIIYLSKHTPNQKNYCYEASLQNEDFQFYKSVGTFHLPDHEVR